MHRAQLPVDVRFSGSIQRLDSAARFSGSIQRLDSAPRSCLGLSRAKDTFLFLSAEMRVRRQISLGDTLSRVSLFYGARGDLLEASIRTRMLFTAGYSCTWSSCALF
jgi:hypothetical protein